MRWLLRWALLGVVGWAVLLAGPASAADHGVAIPSDSNTFSPSTLTIAPGDSVTWTDNSVAPHSVTADNGSFDSSPDCSGSNTTACLKVNDRFSHVFDTPGTFRYYCKIHGSKNGGGMSGVITVQSAQPTILPTTAPPTTQASTTTARATTTTAPRATTTTARATTTTSSTTSSSTTSSTTSTTSTTEVGATTTSVPADDDDGGGGGNGGLLAFLAVLIAAVLGAGGYVLWQLRPDGPGIGPWRRS